MRKKNILQKTVTEALDLVRPEELRFADPWHLCRIVAQLTGAKCEDVYREVEQRQKLRMTELQKARFEKLKAASSHLYEAWRVMTGMAGTPELKAVEDARKQVAAALDAFAEEASKSAIV